MATTMAALRDRVHALMPHARSDLAELVACQSVADPRQFPDAVIEGTYILDPWYPDNSSIWGQSDPPGTFQDLAEMKRNFLPWKRPEGAYPDRDGKWIVLVPTQPAPNATG